MSTRRSILGLAAGAAAGAAAGGAVAAADAGKTFVLVHGTWHGGWVWQGVARRLRVAGHRVYTPTCTGCGERLHLTGPEVGLDTHITDITNVIEFEELDEVILVGHSFAGLTITGVADRLRERIRRLVFFDALVPTAERNAGVAREPDGRFPDWWLARQRKFVDGYQMSFWDEYPIEMLVPPTDAANVALLKRRLTTHPARQWTDPLELRQGGWEGLPRTYIQPTLQTYQPSSDRMVGPARGPGWQFIRLACYRGGMLTHPDELAACLAGLD